MKDLLHIPLHVLLISIGIVCTGNLYAAESAKDIFRQYCAPCHGENGKGMVPGTPDFTDPNGRLKKSDAELFLSVKNGLQSPGSPLAMPPKGGNSDLTDAQIKALIQYIRTTYGH